MKDDKNLKISSELHKKIKIICAMDGIKINEWIEKQLEKIIDEYEKIKQ